jgi:hypothetical protein
LVLRSIQVGGVSKSALLAHLESQGVHLNELGRKLFADARFSTSTVPRTIETAQVTVSNLGFTSGATIAEIFAAAASRGLGPCGLELAPHMRLQFMDQTEGSATQREFRNEAPPGAITVASLPISEDDEDPKGFYLRRIDGLLWLRGYRSWAGHLWKAGDEFVFQRLAG